MFLGLLGVAVGFLFGGLFWGNFVYLGISWIIAAVIFTLAERDLTDGAFLAGLVFGVVGAVIWIVIDMSRTQSGFSYRHYEDKSRYYKRIAQEDYRCGQCFWFGKPACERKEELINAKPCKDFRL